jgi:hypothetical protein
MCDSGLTVTDLHFCKVITQDKKQTKPNASILHVFTTRLSPVLSRNDSALCAKPPASCLSLFVLRNPIKKLYMYVCPHTDRMGIKNVGLKMVNIKVRLLAI